MPTKADPVESEALMSRAFGNAKLKPGDDCPACGGELEQCKHRFSTDRGPNLPDCDWLACLDCGFQTEPE